MIIREATRDDCVKMDELLTKLIRYEKQYNSNINPSYAVKNNYIDRIELSGHKAFVAEIDGNVVNA